MYVYMYIYIYVCMYIQYISWREKPLIVPPYDNNKDLSTFFGMTVSKVKQRHLDRPLVATAGEPSACPLVFT